MRSAVATSSRAVFLLELLFLAGWKMTIRREDPPHIWATRDAIELEASGTSLADAVETMFTQAMRSR